MLVRDREPVGGCRGSDSEGTDAVAPVRPSPWGIVVLIKDCGREMVGNGGISYLAMTDPVSERSDWFRLSGFLGGSSGLCENARECSRYSMDGLPGSDSNVSELAQEKNVLLFCVMAEISEGTGDGG